MKIFIQTISFKKSLKKQTSQNSTKNLPKLPYNAQIDSKKESFEKNQKLN